MQAVVREASLRWYCVLFARWLCVLCAYNQLCGAIHFSRCHSLHISLSTAAAAADATATTTASHFIRYRFADSNDIVSSLTRINSPGIFVCVCQITENKLEIPRKICQLNNQNEEITAELKDKLSIKSSAMRREYMRKMCRNHPCWILNCVYACTNDASNHATFRFILSFAPFRLSRSATPCVHAFLSLSLFVSLLICFHSFSRCIVFVFICSYILCVTCAPPNKSTLASKHMYLHVSSAKLRKNEKSNKIHGANKTETNNQHIAMRHTRAHTATYTHYTDRNHADKQASTTINL